MVQNYSGSLSPEGFFIATGHRNRYLPDGSRVQSGKDFRDSFHLNPLVSADYFVPCGGRPESIDVDNVEQMFNAEGQLRFPYIIEGSNMFITDAARNILQDAGCILFKDTSTNKGGVTSSSFEVLAALSLNGEFE